MSGPEEFESLLKDVMNAKRLSASKTTKLVEIALKNMENDTQLVSTLYRTHKTLPTSSKVSSLYVFDALSRAARGQVVKHHLTGDLQAEKGNCATFLLKVEGVLDGLIEDLISTNVPEIKEKTQKILDIWAKSSTFPANVVTRLSETIKGDLKDSIVIVPPTSDPRHSKPASATPPQVNGANATPPVAGQIALPPALLALLGASFSTQQSLSDSQIPPNSNSAAPALDATQLSLLQQIAEQAKLGVPGGAAVNGGQHHLGLPSSNPSSFVTPTLPSSSMSYPPHSPAAHSDARRHEIYPYDSRDRGSDKWDDHPRDRAQNFNADRNEWRGRGGSRGGYSGRGRGYGGRSGGWDDRGWRDGDRGRDDFRRRSRSRSPPPRGRFGDDRPSRRDPRPFSPRRPIPASGTSNGGSFSPGPGPGKDEFGRDIRAQSSSPPPPDTTVNDEKTPIPPAALPPSTPQTNLPSSSSSSPKNNPTGGGLDQFDFETFDFTSPASWEGLGKAWEVTHGRLPSQEELVSALGMANMANMDYQFGGATEQQMGTDNSQVGGSQWDWDRSGTSARGNFRGGNSGGWDRGYYQQGSNFDRGSSFQGGYRGRGRGGWRGGGVHNAGTSGGDFGNTNPTSPPPASGTTGAYGTSLVDDAIAALASGELDKPGKETESTGGRMTRVGDKWVWQPPPA